MIRGFVTCLKIHNVGNPDLVPREADSSWPLIPICCSFFLAGFFTNCNITHALKMYHIKLCLLTA